MELRLSKARIEISVIQYYLAIVVLLISIISSAIAVGYTIRRNDELYDKVTTLEQKGSVTAQLTSKDVQWISENMKNFSEQLTRVERKLDQHMDRK